jgi:hypothetical protein
MRKIWIAFLMMAPCPFAQADEMAQPDSTERRRQVTKLFRAGTLFDNATIRGLCNQFGCDEKAIREDLRAIRARGRQL